ncbi:MAG: LicD family protein [Eggerthellaceae bacterium]|nr:LicD family protein [Eggerthellaceae bacterium]
MGLSTFELQKRLSNAPGLTELTEEDIKAIQKLLLGIIEDIVTVSNERQISYTLSGGSCLGALRHQGFIPWDDDADINMRRKDWEAFRDALLDKYPGKYIVRDPQHAADYGVCNGHIGLADTYWNVVGCGVDGSYIGVDVFFLENVPDNRVLRYLHGFVSLGLGFASSCRRFAERRDSYLTYASSSEEKRILKFKISLGKLLSFCSMDKWCSIWDKWNSMVSNEESRYLSIPGGRKHYFGELYRREDFFPVSCGTFEGLDAPLPANPDFYMRVLYGPDYMTPPPPEEREKHAVLEFDLGECANGLPDMEETETTE